MGKPFGESLRMPQIATPAAPPPTGYYLMYFKSDGKLYIKDSSGVESAVAAGSGSGGAVLVPIANDPPASDNGDGSLWYDYDDNEGTEPDVLIDPTEPTGTSDGSLWWDSDSTEGAGVDVEFRQPDEPAGTPDGTLWWDSDDGDIITIVPDTRLISTGTGLTGGGDLTLDRTLSVDFAPDGTTSSTQATRADDSRLADARTPLAHTHAGADIVSGTVPAAYLGSGTRDGTKYLRDDNTWQAVSQPSGWHLIQSVQPSGIANAVGGISFLNIPAGYSRFRIVADRLTVITSNYSGHLYLRLNGDAAANYYTHYSYATSGTPSATTLGASAYGLAAGSYVYVGPSYPQTSLVMEISPGDGSARKTMWQAHAQSLTSTGVTYPYTMDTDGLWSSVAAITQIDLWHSGATTAWDSACSPVKLFGWKD